MEQIQAAKQFESRIKEVELKLEAVLEAIGLECEYTAEKYTLVKGGEKGDS